LYPEILTMATACLLGSCTERYRLKPSLGPGASREAGSPCRAASIKGSSYVTSRLAVENGPGVVLEIQSPRKAFDVVPVSATPEPFPHPRTRSCPCGNPCRPDRARCRGRDDLRLSSDYIRRRRARKAEGLRGKGLGQPAVPPPPHVEASFTEGQQAVDAPSRRWGRRANTRVVPSICQDRRDEDPLRQTRENSFHRCSSSASRARRKTSLVSMRPSA